MQRLKDSKEEQKLWKLLKQPSISSKTFWVKSRLDFYTPREKIISSSLHMLIVNCKNGTFQNYQASDKLQQNILVNTNTVLTNNKKHFNNQLGGNMNKSVKIKNNVSKN